MIGSGLRRYAGTLVVAGFSAFICYWYRLYFTSGPVPSVDLPGHIAIVERLLEQWAHGRLFFYDPEWFSGWPVFVFYGFLPHLVATVLALPLQLGSAEPARLAVHLSLVIGCALLPFSMLYAWRPLAEELCDTNAREREEVEPVAALFIGTLAFWFLNHDAEGFGAGAAAVMESGLYAQLFGWHLILIYLGALYRLLLGAPRRNELLVAAIGAFLVVAHTLSAIFAFSFATLAFLRFESARGALLRSHMLAIGLAAFWLVPFWSFAAQYTILHIEYPYGDFLQLLLRYPLYDAVRTMRSWFGGDFAPLDPIPAVILVLLFILLTSRDARRTRLLPAFAVFTLIALIVFSSGLTADSLPLGLHYYRFLGLVLLVVLHLLTAVFVIPLRWVMASKGILGTAGRIALLCVSLLCFLLTTQLPQRTHYLLQQESDPGVRYAEEHAVFDHLRHQQASGRVLFEYFKNRDKFPFLSPHYMPARLFKETGLETANGLFIQSSLAYEMYVLSAKSLGAEMYAVPYLLAGQPDLTPEIAITQLRELGVTHVVASESAFFAAIRPFAVAEPAAFGPYSVVRIAEHAPPAARYVDKTVVGYLDLRGSLPFKLLELYFFSHPSLTSRFELIALEPGGVVPAEVAVIIANGSVEAIDATMRAMTPNVPGPALIKANFEDTYAIEHYHVRYGRNPEQDAYFSAARYLDRQLDAGKLMDFARPASAESAGSVSFQWARDRQSFTVRNATPGRLLRIDYSYFPYWQSRGGYVFRGSAERIFLLPTQPDATVTYRPYAVASWWLGAGVSVLSTLAFAMGFRAGPGNRYRTATSTSTV